jgi:hypothetical protein
MTLRRRASAVSSTLQEIDELRARNQRLIVNSQQWRELIEQWREAFEMVLDDDGKWSWSNVF